MNVILVRSSGAVSSGPGPRRCAPDQASRPWCRSPGWAGRAPGSIIR